MSRMKKAVEKILEDNQNTPQKGAPKLRNSEDSKTMLLTGGGDMSDILRQKRGEVEEFQARARRLVESMRVPDLTHIPERYYNYPYKYFLSLIWL